MSSTGSSDSPHIVKLLMIGDGTVGKTDFLIRYVESKFDPNFIVSIGVDTQQKTTVHKGNTVRVQVWDAAGSDKFRTISPSYYSAAHGVMILYDVTNQASFARVEYWKAQVDQHNDHDIPIIVVGNKTDLVDEHMISLRVPKVKEETLSSKLGVPFYSASAKKGDGVSEAFGSLIDLVLKQRSIPCISEAPQSDQPARRRCGCRCSWWPCCKRKPQPDVTQGKQAGKAVSSQASGQLILPGIEPHHGYGLGVQQSCQNKPRHNSRDKKQDEALVPSSLWSSAIPKAPALLETASLENQAPASTTNTDVSRIAKALADTQNHPLVFEDGEDSAAAEARSPKLTHVESSMVHAPCHLQWNFFCHRSQCRLVPGVGAEHGAFCTPSDV